MVVIDGDADARRLVAGILSNAGFETTEAGTGEEALEAVEREPPELVVLEVRLPGISGYAVCRSIRDDLGDGVGIVFVSAERTEPFDRVAGLLLGADDYMVKPFAPDELVARTQSVLRRTRAKPNGLPGRLTAREHDVLGLLAEGLDQATIARRLVISPKTVATHIEHILAKLGVRTRGQAIALAYREDLLRNTPQA